MTLRSVKRLLLMLAASLSVAPEESASRWSSDPARSTRLARVTRAAVTPLSGCSSYLAPPPPSASGTSLYTRRRRWSCSEKMACEREEASLSACDAVCRCFAASCNIAAASPAASMVRSHAPRTQ